MADTELEDAERIEDQMIRSAKANYQRLPVLEVIFDRFTLALGPMMKSHCAGNSAEATLESFTYTSCGEALDSLSLESLAMVAEAQPWEGDIGVVALAFGEEGRRVGQHMRRRVALHLEAAREPVAARAPVGMELAGEVFDLGLGERRAPLRQVVAGGFGQVLGHGALLWA